ncbi:MAG: hypothetical protein HYZ73_04805 [Elusimicrobia bacterium]|nr:hypothetical protein [Elusimicrobiota bacterium]
MAKAKKFIEIRDEVRPTEVVKNETLKEGPLEEKRSLIKAEVKTTPLGKNVALICDNCYVRDKCPMFKPAQECVFTSDRPAIESVADIMQVIKSLLAVQVQRINQARNIENLDGGYPDGSLSAEMDRFVDYARTLKDLGDTRDTLDIRARGKGIISQIFGDLYKK